MKVAGYELADDVVLEVDGLRMSGAPVRGRACGTCTACCVQVPVDLPAGTKPANQRCPNLCSKGCRVYTTRPDPCQVWSCRWLFDADTAELHRPDRSGVVIDCMPDTVVATGNSTGERRSVRVLQVWCDPKRRDAHRDPALRRYLAGMAERHWLGVIVRWSSTEGMVLVPPCMNPSGEWVEMHSEMKSSAVMAEALAGIGVESTVHRMAAVREARR